ncbi:helix-turn-helix transcriptional regulator [Streptomyces sp. OUCMDZ-4982]|uniref:helix-turn-helix domain-containing protein n=1 Tax=Streptomyces sp. OUCMDZ-4982 TaxID=2973090 RepID=UPI00215D5C63|nr:helix-turn-helix transcriptional regulator [Streptomyces sp. OUCMDZ-4982]MCR8945072.1 helix-turn-helix transcriptional regulator [Streptomyces sp. OUCMDZ-4982]
MSTSSHPGPPQPARSGPAVNAARAARCTEVLRDISEDIAVVADAFMQQTYGTTLPTTDLVDTVMVLRRLTDEAISAIVVRQRSQGEPLGHLAPALDLTVDRLRKKYVPGAVDHALATRRRPRRATTATRPPDDTHTPKNRLRHPRQRLACALSRMRLQAGVTQQTLARRMNVDPSYISRLLSGDRDLSWQHVKAIVDCCDGNADLIKPLWEVAAGVEPTGTDPARYLRTYLQALRYANGSPHDRAVIASSQHAITISDLRQALKGRTVPEWSVVSQLVTALQGLPDVALPLWRRARSSTETTTLRAEAFG